MDIRKLQRAIVDGLEDVKAQNIAVFNTEHLSPLFERVIVASGTSNRQTKALASSVRETVKSRGMEVMRTEGEDNGEWIIVDCGAAVVHVMQPAIREYYHLEEIWGGKPVKLKLGASDGKLVKASEPDDEDEEDAKPKKKAAAKKGAAKKDEAKPKKSEGKKADAKKADGKKAAKSDAKADAKPVSKKRAAKAAEPKGPVTKTLKVGDKKPAAKKPAAKKAAAGSAAAKPAAKRPVAKKAVTKTVGVKKPAAKKTARA